MQLVLYYTPGACSLAPHIVLREARLDFELQKVDLATHKLANGEDYRSVSPNGYVPALRLPDGAILTEASVIVQYLADQAPSSGLAPPLGTFERYRLMETLNFISTEIHKQLAPFFNPALTEEWRTYQHELLQRRFTALNDRLGHDTFLLGSQFTVADAYLYTVLNWTRLFDISLGTWPHLERYMAEIRSRPAVQTALQAEGLLLG